MSDDMHPELTPIKGYEGLYAISEDGRVFSYPKANNNRGRWLKPSVASRSLTGKKGGTGYMTVQLYRSGSMKVISVHRLVALHFIPNPNEYPHINHKDGNKLNNQKSNLEWCTAKYNKNYKIPKKVILVTGIGGAIGVHMLAHIMHNTDWDVIGIDSFKHKGYTDRLSLTFSDHPDWQSRTTVITHDLVAPFTDRQIKRIGKVDYIVNLASLSDVSLSVEDPVTTIRNNTELMLNILEYSRKVKPSVFLQFSTDEVYGAAPVDGGHKEWDTILPSNPYSASKAAQEAIAIAYWRTYGVPLIITNTMNNFGEMQGATKYPALIQTKVNKGEEVTVHAASDGRIGTRYYIHSRNTADAVLFILNNVRPRIHDAGHIDKPKRYNIVGDKQLNNLELAQEIAKLMGKKLLYKLVDFHSSQPGHDLDYGLNGGKLHKLGWKAPMSFEDSMKNTIEWQQQHKEWM